MLLWSDYCPPGFIKAFKKKTGITMNFTGIGSNEEIINKMKATKGRGFDVCSPTNMRSLQWEPLGLIQPIDYGRIPNVKNLNPAMLAVGDNEWNFGGKGSHWLPQIWGTEGIAWRNDKWTPPRSVGGVAMPSYGDIWQSDVEGKTMMRPHSDPRSGAVPSPCEGSSCVCGSCRHMPGRKEVRCRTRANETVGSLSPSRPPFSGSRSRTFLISGGAVGSSGRSARACRVFLRA